MSSPERAASPLSSDDRDEQVPTEKSSDKGKILWTFEEDRILASLVETHGVKSWSKLAQHIPGRTGKQIRERWRNQLDPCVNKDSWTAAEDAAILQAQETFNNQWTAIAKLLPGRTGNAVKNRWYSTLRRIVSDSEPPFMRYPPTREAGAPMSVSPGSDGLHRLDLGDIALENGSILHGAWIAYAIFGYLNHEGNNCILYPTSFKDDHLNHESMIGDQRALDPSKWFIVVPSMLGAGRSVSPSNAQNQGRFPAVSMYDNMKCQKRLLDYLHVKTIKLAMGWSVGATQAWYWAVFYPGMVQNLLSICGGCRCWPHHQIILKGARLALEEGAGLSMGSGMGMRCFARSFMPWAYSAAFFRGEHFRQLGYGTSDDLAAAWEDECLRMVPDDLAATLRIWQQADVSAHQPFGGDLARALGCVRARCIVMPCDRDQLIAQEEIMLELSMTGGAELRPIVSTAGHFAGQPGRFKRETGIIEATIVELLAPQSGEDYRAPRAAAPAAAAARPEAPLRRHGHGWAAGSASWPAARHVQRPLGQESGQLPDYDRPVPSAAARPEYADFSLSGSEFSYGEGADSHVGSFGAERWSANKSGPAIPSSLPTAEPPLLPTRGHRMQPGIYPRAEGQYEGTRAGARHGVPPEAHRIRFSG